MRTTIFQRVDALTAAAGATLLPVALAALDAPWPLRMRAVELRNADEDSSGLEVSITEKRSASPRSIRG